MSITFKKRQKEMKRQEKQRAKAEWREQKRGRQTRCKRGASNTAARHPTAASVAEQIIAAVEDAGTQACRFSRKPSGKRLFELWLVAFN